MAKIDLSKYEGHTPLECNGCMQSHCETCPDHKEALRRIHNFHTILEYARKLEAEVERLQGIVDAQSECMVNSALTNENLRTHAAEMSATLEGFVAYGEKAEHEIKPTSDLYICHIPRAEAALAEWCEAQGQGDDNNAK